MDCPYFCERQTAYWFLVHLSPQWLRQPGRAQVQARSPELLSPISGARTQELGPPSAALPGALVRSWVGSGTAGTPTGRTLGGVASSHAACRATQPTARIPRTHGPSATPGCRPQGHGCRLKASCSHPFSWWPLLTPCPASPDSPTPACPPLCQTLPSNSSFLVQTLPLQAQPLLLPH